MKAQSSRCRENSNMLSAGKVKDVPYVRGMGWRIMDVIDLEVELQQFYKTIEMIDFINKEKLKKTS